MAAEDPPSTSPALLQLLTLPESAEAWKEFVDRYCPMIEERCRRAGLQRADAEDVLAVVCAQLVDPIRRFRGYLQRVVVERLTEVADGLWSTLASAADRDSAPASTKEGPTIAGYEDFRLLGRGGSGVVYLATESASGRKAAVKLLRGGTTASPRERAWFLDEARAADLDAFRAGRPVAARPVGRLQRLGRWARREPVVAGLSSMAAERPARRASFDVAPFALRSHEKRGPNSLLSPGEGARRADEGRRIHHGFGFTPDRTPKPHDPHPALRATFSRGEKECSRQPLQNSATSKRASEGRSVWAATNPASLSRRSPRRRVGLVVRPS